MARRAFIGVTGPARGYRLPLRCITCAIRLAGGRSRNITPANPSALEEYDGFVLSGGGDINPELYGEAAVAQAIQYDLERDALEQAVIRYALSHHKPLLGICRGMQILNVTLGGSLYQEAKEVLEGFLPNESLFSKCIGRRTIWLEQNSLLFGIMGNREQHRVNSIHHQAINRLGEGLRVVAREKNGLIQAIEPSEHSPLPFLIGVQWHPELMMHTRAAHNLFRALLAASRL